MEIRLAGGLHMGNFSRQQRTLAEFRLQAAVAVQRFARKIAHVSLIYN